MYAALILIAVVFARHAPVDERRGVFALSVLVAANWLLTGWTYAEHAPQHWVGLSAPDFWSIADAMLGAAALTISRRWWAWGLWAALTGQVILHVTHPVMIDAAYLWGLDRFLDAQLAIFIFAGGRGVLDRLSYHCARLPALRWLVQRSGRVLAAHPRSVAP